ncbi:Putative pentatricopeptide repeat-containing protein [Dendrobium catenatum]|uniref:Pentatricopeptide repeat-containing protein n=1 Tax=Dendrobium catenatum TaxID=906689 RepID=A0A2I0VWZ5_9ASPA|nr:Putative pentatricopeptide repeat-containing protein [Dendrobium catenatum]
MTAAHPFLSKIGMSLGGIHVLASRLMQIQMQSTAKCLPNNVFMETMPQNPVSVADAMRVLMQINSKAKDVLRKLLLMGDFDAFPDEEQRHDMARLAKNLHAYVIALPNNIPTKEAAFLLEVCHGLLTLRIAETKTYDVEICDKTASSRIRKAFTTGVKMLHLDLTDNVDPVQCSQAARRNVATNFGQLVVDDFTAKIVEGDRFTDQILHLLEITKQEQHHELFKACEAASLSRNDLLGRGKDKEFVMQFVTAMPEKNVYTWSSAMSGLALNGADKQCIEVFELMEKEELEPNEITFVSILRGCSIAGLVDRGLEYFDLMKSKYGIEPWPEHYGCMVDLYGRDGRLEEAILQEENIENKVFDPGICLMQQSLFH